jgi:hypothetical protein
MRAMSCCCLSANERVSFTMVDAPLGMPDDHGRGTGVCKHLGGNIAGARS